MFYKQFFVFFINYYYLINNRNFIKFQNIHHVSCNNQLCNIIYTFARVLMTRAHWKSMQRFSTLKKNTMNVLKDKL